MWAFVDGVKKCSKLVVFGVACCRQMTDGHLQNWLPPFFWGSSREAGRTGDTVVPKYLTSSLGVTRTKSFIHNSGSEYFGVELLNSFTKLATKDISIWL